MKELIENATALCLHSLGMGAIIAIFAWLLWTDTREHRDMEPVEHPFLLYFFLWIASFLVYFLILFCLQQASPYPTP